MQKYSVAIEEVATVNRFCNVIGHAVIVAEVISALIRQTFSQCYPCVLASREIC